MNKKFFIFWFSAVGIIGIGFGLVYAFFGLGVLPVERDVLVPWGNGVYGATLIGFGAVLFFVGRHAFRVHDRELMKGLLYSTFAWLIVEGLFSVYYGVYFNVAVDIMLMIITGYPLMKGIKSLN